MADINGIVTLGASETPGAATVLLLNEAGDTIVASTTSGGEVSSDSVVTLLHFNGSDGSTVFADDTGKTWTVTGNAQIDTAQARFGGASGLFDGNSDAISCTDASFSLGSTPFTIEFWVRAASLPANWVMFDMRPDGAQALCPTIYASGSTLKYFVNGSDQISGGTIVVGQWHHVAYCKEAHGGVGRLFLDGVSVGTATDNTTYGQTRIRIGASGQNVTSLGTNGHFDEMRVTKGVARYTSNFTPPAAPFSVASTGAYSFTGLPGNTTYRVVVLGNKTYRSRAYGPCTTANTDSHWANVVSLLHFDGADGSTTISDAKGMLTWTAVGNAQIDTAQSKFGGASGLFDGAGDCVEAGASEGFNFGTGDFTIEMFVRFTGAGRAYLFSLGTNQAALIVTPSSGAVEVYGPGSYVINAGATSFATGAWFHIALVRSGNTWTVYRNGAAYVSATDSRAWGNNANVLDVGLVRSPDTNGLNGHIDELRITKGVARYTANFTPPTAPFPNS